MDVTNNINTWLDAWEHTQISKMFLLSSPNMERLEKRILAVADSASVCSKRVFSKAQCAEFIRSWPEYKAAVERLGGGEK